jgi:hypothetical protein
LTVKGVTVKGVVSIFCYRKNILKQKWTKMDTTPFTENGYDPFYRKNGYDPSYRTKQGSGAGVQVV